MSNYPRDIIPQSAYKSCIFFSPLLKTYPDLMVLRLVRGDVSEFTDDGSITGNLTAKIFDCTIQNLSLNLLGGLYKVEHRAFLPQNLASHDWNGRYVNFEKYQDEFIEVSPCFHVCFKVKDIHNVTYPFPITFQNEEERNSMCQKIQDICDNETELKIDQEIVEKFVDANTPCNVQVMMKLNHRPNFLNYWHVTLDTPRAGDTNYIMPEEKLKNRDRKQMKAFKQHLFQIMNVTNDVPYKLKRKDYKEKLSFYDRVSDWIMKIESSSMWTFLRTE